MTRECIEGMRKVVLPFVKENLAKINYKDQGKNDSEEFEKDFNEILNLAIKALEKEPCEDAVSRTEITYELNRLGRNVFKDDTDYDNFFAFVDSLPSVTPTRKKGKWVNKSHKNSCGTKNCCFSKYVFSFDNEKMAKKFVSVLNDSSTIEPFPGSFQAILRVLGYSYDPETEMLVDGPKYNYGGELWTVSRSGNTVSVDTVTKWEPLPGVFATVLYCCGVPYVDGRFSGVKVRWKAEEPDLEVYKASDPEFAEGEGYEIFDDWTLGDFDPETDI